MSMNNNTNHPTTMRIDCLEARAGRSAFSRLKGEESIFNNDTSSDNEDYVPPTPGRHDPPIRIPRAIFAQKKKRCCRIK